MTNKNLENSEDKIKDQKRSFTLILVIIIIIVIAVSVTDWGNNTKNTVKTKKYKIDLTDPSIDKFEDRYLEKTEFNLKKNEEDISIIKNENIKLRRGNQNLEEEVSLLYDKLESLEIYLMQRDEKQKNVNNKSKDSTNNNQNENSQPSEQYLSIETIKVFDEESDNSGINNNKVFKISEGYIPQASYVRAKILSSVDAQVGISSQSNPKPVLLKIIGKAKSAVFEDEIISVDMEGCKVTAGAIGEISSEKVYIKLSKMTCAKNDDEIVEIPIEGYVASLGSSGVRGDVIMREGNLLTKSFLAGAFGGLGGAYSQSLAPPLTFGGGTTTQNSISTDDALKQGLGSGIGSSSDRLSQYLIKRAEQYQPVISIPSGIEVELVFVKGFYLDNRQINSSQNENN